MRGVQRLELAEDCRQREPALCREWGLLPGEFARRWAEADVLKENAKNSLRLFAGQDRSWLVKSQRLPLVRRWLGQLWPSRMRNSLRASEQLQSAGIACVPVWACWSWGGCEFSIQPYSEGAQSLWQRAEAGTLQSADVETACSLLLALHRAGLCHGDAKLANILRKPDATLGWIDLDNVAAAETGGARQARDLARLLIDLYTWQLDSQAAALVRRYQEQGGGFGSPFWKALLTCFGRFAERHARQYDRHFLLEKIESLRQLLS